jgi:hypothetical protein
MITRILLSILVLSFGVVGEPYAGQQARNGRWNETTAIHGLPFCALTLREFFDRDQHERTVYVLMEPSQVNEGNLHLLFRSISQRFPNDPNLKVWVDTDVEQLGTLATGQMVTVSPGFGATAEALPTESKRVLQMALYKRTESVELFRYNPNYPKSGERTVIIRGKED